MNNQTMSELTDMLNGMREQVTHWNRVGDEYRNKQECAHTCSEAYGMARAYAASSLALERILVADYDRREAAGEHPEEYTR